MDIKKSYYAVVPASVRYDSNLCANSKLLYGEITALCNEKGYCWASNQYFADLYDVSKITISRWISSLEKYGYIKVELIYKSNTKEIESRKIWIVDSNTNSNLSNRSVNENVDKPDTNNGKQSTEKYKDEIKEIIDYLNTRANCRYRYNTESTNKLIRAKLNNGFTVDDFKVVIDTKVNEWVGTEFEKYLRPYTLFGNKFEQYLNQKHPSRSFDPKHPTRQTPVTEERNNGEFFTDDNGNMITY